MAVQHTFKSPYTGLPTETYAVNMQFAIDLGRKRIDIYVNRYADRASADAGLAPLQSVPYTIQGAAFDAYVASNQAAYLAIKQAVEAFLLTRPEFQGGEIVD